ncbi:MAG: phosphoribosylformylglycinamidine synthase subunit PurL [Planctomycetota bacterium]
MALWEIDIYPAEGQADREGKRIAQAIAQQNLVDDPAFHVALGTGFLIEGNLDQDAAEQLAKQLLVDPVTQRSIVGRVGGLSLAAAPEHVDDDATVVHVLPKPGVMDPTAESTLAVCRDAGFSIDAVTTFRKYWMPQMDAQQIQKICRRALSNDAIEQFVLGPLAMERLDLGSVYEFAPVSVEIRNLDDDGLQRLSKEGQLYLTLVEMQTIAQHFQELGREPTDIELESIAQTWSEHCSHKTLAGRISYRGPSADGTADGDQRQFDNMLKETIFAATQNIRKSLGDQDWCVSVFKDNAGVVTFNESHHVCFKVETHNHPSALEPYGGANTGIGGVIRDPMGTGMGAKPFCNTDVFCFAPPETPVDSLPQGVLHPRRVMKGVVEGVRDYGNRMGIPTINGAVYFDPRYLGNPLVYCGNAGLIPVGMEDKEVRPDDYIVAIGGRTGRDGIHGATFSSAELTSESESLSGGAVQIGNAITEKMVLDVLLAARDQGLYNAVTDCGAGGFSSAVGEMGEQLGAEVWLEQCPLKYEGLSYTEIWISEAQERMVLSVPADKWETLQQLCESEGVEATRIGRFVATGRLHLMYDGKTVGNLPMSFLHDGRPPIVRDAVYSPPASIALGRHVEGRHVEGRTGEDHAIQLDTLTAAATKSLHQILGSLNVASKHWIIRQYDHEVQGGSVVKPLVGPQCEGPSDAAVVRPLLESRRGVVIACGMNPHFGDYDTYHMAASAIDEAVRNAVAVGADPDKIAILDNFCWGYTDRPETLGSLVRAAIACQDVAETLGTPFISGKDSLNNEFSYDDDSGERQTISIPSSLLISAMGQIDDVKNAVTMDLKQSGNAVYLVGETGEHFGGSHFSLVNDLVGGDVPTVDAAAAKSTFAAMHTAISSGSVRSCHDLSEGGLAVAAAEMAFGGDLGMQIDLHDTCQRDGIHPVTALFSESNTRFLVEVSPDQQAAFEAALRERPTLRIGRVTDDRRVRIANADRVIVDESCDDLRNSWRSPLDFE